MHRTNSDWAMLKIALWDEHARASDALRAVPGIGSGPMGMTPDAVKASPEYRAAKLAYERAHAELRAFNAALRKAFPKRKR
jgi:hypothetical protein